MQDLEDEFAFLDDWEDRYRHVIEMGKALPGLDDAQKNPDTKINGCVSQVWLLAHKNSDGTFSFSGDSDAHIVRGLVAVLFRLIEAKTADEILQLDAVGFFNRIGLSDNLSPQRANGLVSMIKRVERLARESLG
jgi:cysteine desulfuration protein SufE